MKKGFVILLFLVLISGVSAMNGPIKIMTDPGNTVSVFIWTFGGGPILNEDRGAVDSDGVFSTKVFFSLNVPYKLNVVVRDSNGEIDENFERDVTEVGFEDGMNVDCRSGDCIVSVGEPLVVEPVVEEEVVNESEDSVVVNESNDSIVVDDVSDDVVVDDISLEGRALFFKEDGSINWFYSGAGVVVLGLFLVFIFMMFRNGKPKKAVLDDDEKELEDMEGKVKETERKIQKVKDGKIKRRKIYEAKLKLAEEEKELSELEGDGNRIDEKVEAQEKAVEDAEEMVDKAEDVVVDKSKDSDEGQ